MEKILISIPDNLASRFRAIIPAKQRSKLITKLLEIEVLKKERSLYECALAVEQDRALNEEMEDWGVVVGDGIDDASR